MFLVQHFMTREKWAQKHCTNFPTHLFTINNQTKMSIRQLSVNSEIQKWMPFYIFLKI